MREYGRDYEGYRPGQAPREAPRGGFYGYGKGGYYGDNMYGRRGYGADYLSAWGPGGWSREHGRELHGGSWGPPRGARDPRGYRGRPWWYDDGAPTG
jgi:hypothetical protein